MTQEKAVPMHQPVYSSPVTITRANGTVEQQPAYSEARLIRIVEKGRRQPRTWNEVNSCKGGGKDFVKPT
jgi:hypothetical protein